MQAEGFYFRSHTQNPMPETLNTKIHQNLNPLGSVFLGQPRQNRMRSNRTPREPPRHAYAPRLVRGQDSRFSGFLLDGFSLSVLELSGLRNPLYRTLGVNPKPQTLNPKPSALNPKRETLNP